MNNEDDFLIDYFDEYPDIKGNPIQVGDVIIDWCTGERDKHAEPVKVGDMWSLDQMYVTSWGMLEIRNDLEPTCTITKQLWMKYHEEKAKPVN